METSELLVSNNNGNASVKIAFLLTEDDYNAVWNGVNGAGGYYTDNVNKIHDLFSEFAIGKYGIDLQIWEGGNAFVDNIDYARIEELKSAIEAEFNVVLEIAERY